VRFTSRLNDVNHLLDDDVKESRAAQTNLLKCLSVELKQVKSALDLGIRGIPIQWETMIRLILPHVTRHSSKAVNWETSVIVIKLKDLTHCTDCLFILILSTEEMKRIWLRIFSVRSCVVNSDA
jgi:hypothetical protein